MSGVDDYGLPIGIFGRHPEEFYGAIGRIVCLCAVLEDRATTLRHGMAHARQGQYTQQPVSTQIKVARSLCGGLPDCTAHRVTAYLNELEEAFRRRNELAHSSFPAQEDGRLWGHRPTRDPKVFDGTADTVETSLDELKAFIRQLARLVDEFNPVYAIATNPPR